MITKISKGGGFKGVIAYVAGKSGAEYVGGNVSQNPKLAAREMGALKKYSQCRTPVWHCSLSLSPEDRQLSNQEFKALAEKFMQKMGLQDNQYTVYKHTDRVHAHVHIICNRIGLDPKHAVWNAWQDIKRALEAKSELESEFNLLSVPHNPKFAVPDITRGEREEARRKGVMPAKQYVAEAIASAIQRGNVQDFMQSLKANGIEAIPNISSTGRMNGFSFRLGRRHYKGSQLRCSWRELAPKLHYDAERDNEFLFSLVPEGNRPQNTEEIREHSPRRKRTIYTRAEWLHMGGERNSDYKRAYQMITDGYSLREVAHEIMLHSPSMSEEQLRRILYRSGQLWIDNNRHKLLWAYNSRRRYIRFSSDPAIMLLQVLGLLVATAVKAILRDMEERHTTRKLDSLSQELKEMAAYAEKNALKRSYILERIEREHERGNPLLQHAQEIGLERSR